MKLCLVLSLAFALLGSNASAVEGTFRGKITDPPANEPAVKGWIFVKGRNQMLRRVEVAHAEIVYGAEVPAHQRHDCNSDCLTAGQEVRVTARQDAAGEWRARRVEILKLNNQKAETLLQARALPNFTQFWAARRITKRNEFCIAPFTG
jgi:hypothetical protein